jgi:hypothetical protein
VVVTLQHEVDTELTRTQREVDAALLVVAVVRVVAGE